MRYTFVGWKRIIFYPRILGTSLLPSCHYFASNHFAKTLATKELGAA
jgi:hypothetical protein